jgi:hypothetical protein
VNQIPFFLTHWQDLFHRGEPSGQQKGRHHF